MTKAELQSLGCPHKLRADLPPMIPRIAKLPVDERGYPVPFFVDYLDGKPEFRAMDGRKLVRCLKEKLCWVCGDPMGVNKSFLIGPMCAITRTTSEPSAHLDCAVWSARACPFLTKPQMVRREDDVSLKFNENVAGFMVRRNPGVMCIWNTRSFTIFRSYAGGDGILFAVGDPDSVSWWREGRAATRQECLQSIESGLPLLLEKARDQKECAEIERARDLVINTLLPNL